MPRPKHRRSSDISNRLVGEIVASKPESKLLSGRKQINQFLRHYFGNMPVDDLQGRSFERLGRAAIGHLEFGRVRKPGNPLLRIFNPDLKTHGYVAEYTIVEMVNDDMPFLVDSVSAAIDRQNLVIHTTVHPIFRVLRDAGGRLKDINAGESAAGQPESFIRFAIDRIADEHLRSILEHEILKVLADVRVAVRDWGAMRGKMLEASATLSRANGDAQLRRESEALLQWMADDHFTFLGYREYKLQSRGQRVFLRPVKGSGLGVLVRDERGGRAVELTKSMLRVARSKDLLIITKANSRSTVHRRSYLDYVGVKVYNNDGEPVGEKRFIGLFTSVAYSESPRNIPLLRLKVQRVVEGSNLNPAGHRGKSLIHILDTFPRDELFQSTVADLVRTTNGILNLQDRKQVKFFLRRDTFRRFFSCIVYIPREKYTTAVRGKVEKILLDAFAGLGADTSVQISDSPLARVHIIVRTGSGERPKISIRSIEQEIADAVVTWRDKLRICLVEKFGQDEGLTLNREFGEVFPLAYEEDVLPSIACLDIKRVHGLLRGEHNDALLLHQPRDAKPDQLNLRTFHVDNPLALSSVLPILEDMGTEVYGARNYRLRLADGHDFWIQDFELRHSDIEQLDLDAAAQRYQDGFRQILDGKSESDGFDRLILAAGLDWRQVTAVRCYAKYLLQLRIPFSQNYMEDVLEQYPGVVRSLIDQFELQFNPQLSASKRKQQLEVRLGGIRRAIDRAKNLDEDRILSAFSRAVGATLRTNYYQTTSDGHPKDYLSIKLDPAQLLEAPLPRPKFEIFVYSPRVEGVHLRGGSIARGGLRWSDRREDFRTEILGLMKAQVVKNTVIVPTGAKGGFVPKQLPVGDRDEIMAEGIACYRMFISGLLDLTDNLVNEKVVPPPQVVRRDADDPYLVVAADKGTATFSDIANSVSAEYGFWLDDAFASGGSAGYDHKKMGITARGAWEAVRRHFRELGVDVQKDPFTVAGIGDMAGDVFGNGMLLSRKIKLVAAFNHQHIFLDPDPDMTASFNERRRLFKLPRSSWMDYKEELISKGGGVFSRQAKQIRLSSQARGLLGTEETSVQPLNLISLILKMNADLLWNGGIGTYVKASSESHSDVGDRSNDNVRVDADQLQCKVIGEGGNLGLTQLARIEFSLNGGRVNTDFIDNSAGVDSSDREVNIKILLGTAERSKGLTRARRNKLLSDMTDDVAAFVLRNNYLQTQAISMAEARARERLDESARLIINLERTGLLNRDLEFLPSETEIDDRRQRKQGLTRPEIAVILSYAKIDLYNGLEACGESLADFLELDPQRYFPATLRKRYHDLIPTHPLSREILATLIANTIVNRMGPAFVQRLQQDTGASTVTIARSYIVARELCQASEIWRDIEALDNEIAASIQQSMMFEVSRILRHTCYWLIGCFGESIDIVKTVKRLNGHMSTLYSRSQSIVIGPAKDRQRNVVEENVRRGVPEKLARRMAGLLLTRGGLDIADLSQSYRKDAVETADMYSELTDRLGIIWLSRNVESLRVRGRWQAMARSNLRHEFYALRRDLSEKLMKKRGKGTLSEQFVRWLEANAPGIAKFDSMVDDMKLRQAHDFAALSVAAQELRKLIEQ
ncbi:MAG: NAD-glutamate dehydrogenase [Gammaproteobacteria bacterium]|nr:NAD-glutamate dehydrogenase [Gammaproteobacteria bacterium]